MDDGKTCVFKALTICNPYPHFILATADELNGGDVPKRVENRKWATAYRGPLAIHAGVSTAWMEDDDRQRYPGLVFGAVVGIVDMVACVQYAGIQRKNLYFSSRYSWLAQDPHASGPYCFVLENPRRLLAPFPVRGQLGLWDVAIPEDLLP